MPAGAATGTRHRTRRNGYSNAGQRRRPLLLVRASERIGKGLVQKIFKRADKAGRALTRTHNTDNGGGEGERGGGGTQ